MYFIYLHTYKLICDVNKKHSKIIIANSSMPFLKLFSIPFKK